MVGDRIALFSFQQVSFCGKNGGHVLKLFVPCWASNPWDTGYAHQRASKSLLEEPLESTAFRRDFLRKEYRAQLQKAKKGADYLPPKI